MWAGVRRGLRARPEATEHVLAAVMQYLQARYMFERSGLWDPFLARTASPGIAAMPSSLPA